MSPSQVGAAQAAALFVSAVQFSTAPSVREVRAAVIGSIAQHGLVGCVAMMAQEYGEHPREAAARMALVLKAIRVVYRVPDAPEPVWARRWVA